MGGSRAGAPAISLLTAGVAVALMLLAPAAANAQLTWTAPQTLSVAEQNAEAPQVAVDGQGNAVAVWRRFDGANWRVEAAFRAAGGNFGQPLPISNAGADAAPWTACARDAPPGRASAAPPAAGPRCGRCHAAA